MGTEEFVAKGNIERFERKLKASHDDAQRKVLVELIAAERARLNGARSS